MLVTSSRSGVDPAFRRRLYRLQLSRTIGGPRQQGEGPTISVSYTIGTSSGCFDAFEVATGCITAWEAFLSEHGLWQQP